MNMPTMVGAKGGADTHYQVQVTLFIDVAIHVSTLESY